MHIWTQRNLLTGYGTSHWSLNLKSMNLSPFPVFISLIAAFEFAVEWNFPIIIQLRLVFPKTVSWVSSFTSYLSLFIPRPSWQHLQMTSPSVYPASLPKQHPPVYFNYIWFPFSDTVVFQRSTDSSSIGGGSFQFRVFCKHVHFY